MKHILLILLLIPALAFGQTIDIPKAGQWKFVDSTVPPDTVKPCQTCPPGKDGEDGKTPIVTVGTTTTVPYTSPASVVGVPTANGVMLNFAIPQGAPAQNSGGSGIKNWYDITAYGAREGAADNTAAIQAAIDACIANRGTLYIPNSNSGYVTTGTLYISPKSGNQAFIDIVGQGHYGFQIIYKGPSGTAANKKAAVVIAGLKTGNISRLHVRIGDGISHVVGIDIGTMGSQTSTSVFTFEDCSVETKDGTGNIGWRLGEIEGANDDVSQIQFDNCSSWGLNAGLVNGVQQHYKDQVGWLLNGDNTLGITWTAGGASFIETAVKALKSGTYYFFGFETSQTALDFYQNWGNNIAVFAGRFEGGKRFYNCQGSSSAAIFSVHDAMISEYKPEDGIIFNHGGPGRLHIENCSIIRGSADYDARMVTLRSSTGANGSFKIEGGVMNASDQFFTASGYRVRVEDVIKCRANDFQVVGYFTNR